MAQQLKALPALTEDPSSFPEPIRSCSCNFSLIGSKIFLVSEGSCRCEPPRGYWESNSGPLEGQPVLLIAVTSL